MNKTLAMIAVTAIITLGAAGAAPLPEANPDDAGFSKQGLARLDSFFAREIAAKRVPGAVVAVARDGKLVHYKAYGTLDRMWVEDGYFCREPGLHGVKFAFTNYGVSVGLQAVNAMLERIGRINAFFEVYRSEDDYDREAITHVMACSSHFPGYLVRSFG